VVVEIVGRGNLLAGRYRLDEPVGTDLPGVECWHARDQILDRPVRALVLRAGRLRQAQDAARRAALVSDPRLLRVLDVGDHGGVPYVVTERVPGRDLAELTAGGPLPAGQARAIIGEAAVALEVARRRGVHHLALRPSAVHLTPQGAVLVSGLALDGELAGHGLGDARSTTRADTVGLVALLYLLLTGRWPAPAGVTTTGSSAPVVTGEPPAPGDLVEGVPNDLDTLCAVTLGPHDDGPHSPAELVRELEPWGALSGADVFADADARAAATVAARTIAPLTPPTPSERAPTVVDAEPVADAPPGADVEHDVEPPPVVVPDGATVVPDGGTALSLDEDDAEVDESSAVRRTPVASSMARTPGPAARPGTPPPAIPPATRRPDPRSPAAASLGAVAALPGTTSTTTPPPDPAQVTPPAAPRGVTSPRPPVVQPPRQPAARPSATTVPGGHPRDSGRGHPADDHRDFDSIIGRSAEVLTRKRFDPTPVVLALVAIAVVVGLVLAWQSLTAPAPPIGGTDGFGDVTDTGEPTAPDNDAEGGDEGAAAPPDEEVAGPVAVIAGAQMIDPPPGGDQNEHPEAVPAAIDGDPATFWFSRTYASATYGMKPGIGFAVTLAEPATVTTITLLVNGSGGTVEVRSTDPATPTEGEVLASGPLSPETVLTLSAPTTTSSIVLWFTALPQTPDGSNRVELAEVRLS